MSIILLATVHEFLHDLKALGLGYHGSLLHLLMSRNLLHILASEVGDHGYAIYTHSCMVGHNHLRNGGHTHTVATDYAVVLILGRSLECRTSNAHIHSVHQAYPLLLGYLIGKLHQLGIVGISHCRETCAQFRIVLSAQRMLGE